MTPPPRTSLLGVLLTICFILALGGLLLWEFRGPRPVAPDVAKAGRSLDVADAIVVPITRSICSQLGVELACRLARE